MSPDIGRVNDSEEMGMDPSRGRLWRTRWAAIGAAVAVSVGAGGVMVAYAGGDGASSFVPITPCRLIDTRANSTVGTRSTPLGSAETATFAVQGANGDCNIPSTASAVAANATVVNGTAASFLTLWPSDAATRPKASSLNWVANQPPTPNKVDIKLSVDGKMSAFNNVGTVDLIVDVVGYYKVDNPGVDGVDFAEDRTSRVMVPLAVTTMTSIVVSAPFAGFVIVSGAAQFVNSNESIVCDVSPTTSMSGWSFGIQGQAPVALVTAVRGFPVEAGDTTFRLLCKQDTGVADSVTAQLATITASYSVTRA